MSCEVLHAQAIKIVQGFPAHRRTWELFGWELSTPCLYAVLSVNPRHILAHFTSSQCLRVKALIGTNLIVQANSWSYCILITCSFWLHLLSTFKGHFGATLLAAISFMTEDFDILLELVCWYVYILMPDTLKVHYVGFWGDLWAEMESIYSIIYWWNVCIRAVTTNHEENKLFISTRGGGITSTVPPCCTATVTHNSGLYIHNKCMYWKYPARTWRPSYALIHPQKVKGKRGAFKGWNPTEWT